MSTIKICHFCTQHICESNKRWDLHHENYESLQASADEFCVFCSTLVRAIERQYENPKELVLPVYRWNIRRVTRTRDTRDIVSLVFRPILHPQAPSVGEKGGLLQEMTFHFYRESDAGFLPTQAQLGPSTDSAESWAQVHSWIEECRTHHQRCKRKSMVKLPYPTRLLDINEISPDRSKWSLGKMQLVNTNDTQIEGPYVTVSHKWGTKPFKTSTAANAKQAMTGGFPMHDDRLTPNFREAISVARHLGVRFIWIDSLCILQGNPEDFRNEAPRMHDYYRHALCNIAAADAEEPDDGLFRVRDHSDTHFPTGFARFKPGIDNRNFGEGAWVVIPVNLWEDQLLQEPLYSRGWVFQERLLAPRILHFTKNQVFFECATISACEMLPAGIPRISDARASTDRHWRERLQYGISTSERNPIVGTADLSIEDFWATTVNTYTRCDLTRGSDKVVALSGVATLVENALGQEYRDGLWSNNLEEQLAWHVVECRQENGDDSRRPEDRDFPTWSWASVDGVVAVQDRFAANDREFRVRGHDDKSIRFERDRKLHHIDTPDVLKVSKGLVQVKQPINTLPSHASLNSKAAPAEIDYSKAWKRLKVTYNANSLIKIRGHVRHAHILWNFEDRKGTMTPQGPVKVTCETFLDELPPRRAGDYALHKEYECSFFVLAYSRSRGEDDEAQATYFGIGLIVYEESTDQFSRRGTFNFHSLNDKELATLIPPEVSAEEGKENKNHWHARDFCLC